MSNLNSFSDNVEIVLTNASKIAKKYGNIQVGTEHILYGLTTIPSCPSTSILASFGVNPSSLELVFDETRDTIHEYGTIEMTPQVKEMIRVAQKIAMQLGHNFIGTEHILYAILCNPTCYAVRVLSSYFNVNVNDLKTQILLTLQDQNKDANKAEEPSNGIKSDLPEKLLKLGTDITLKAKQGKIDPVIGRENEIERIIEILCRKTKNNPVLIGEAGVGKTAIVEGLADAIASGNVPELLAGKSVFSLEIGSLMAGTKFRGSMEEKLKDAIETIISNGNIIVFIDEIHTLAQAGSEKGETSPADMLKPYLIHNV